MKTFTKLFLFFLFITLTNCNTTKYDNFDWGYVIDGSYQNKFFGIDWKIPEGWSYDDTYAQQWAKGNKPDFESFAEKVYDIKQRIKIEPNEVKESLIFQLSKHKVGVEGPNPAIVVYSENFALIENTDVQNIDEYLTQSIKEFNKAPQITLDSEVYETDRIGGTKFYRLTATVQEGDVKQLQRYYTTDINDFGLTFVLSAPNEGGLEELEEVLRRISF